MLLESYAPFSGITHPDHTMPFFSHIYAERDALTYPTAQQVLRSLPNACVVPVAHYKDIFNRAGQDFDAQKQSPKLILAVKRDKFLFPGSTLCDAFGHARFYYVAQMMNCPYHCEYCYLRGMYTSGNIVAFVNTADYFQAAHNAGGSFLLSISYDTDLLALERLFHFAEGWIGFAAEHPAVTLEIRTKSASFSAIAHIPPVPNVVLSWTLSTDETTRFEHHVPETEKRLHAMLAAAEAGWHVRICVEPVMLTEGWEDGLRRLLRTACGMIYPRRLHGVSVGGFRIPSTYYKRMRKLRPLSPLFALPLSERGGAVRYSETDESRILAVAEEETL